MARLARLGGRRGARRRASLTAWHMVKYFRVSAVLLRVDSGAKVPQSYGHDTEPRWTPAGDRMASAGDSRVRTRRGAGARDARLMGPMGSGAVDRLSWRPETTACELRIHGGSRLVAMRMCLAPGAGAGTPGASSGECGGRLASERS